MADGQEFHDDGVLEAPEAQVRVIEDTVDPGLQGLGGVPEQVVDRL